MKPRRMPQGLVAFSLYPARFGCFLPSPSLDQGIFSRRFSCSIGKQLFFPPFKLLSPLSFFQPSTRRGLEKQEGTKEDESRGRARLLVA